MGKVGLIFVRKYTFSQIERRTIEPKAPTAPIIIAAHAPAAVPRFQYNPPMMQIPDPAMKIETVICQKSITYSFSGNRTPKQKTNRPTMMIDKRSHLT